MMHNAAMKSPPPAGRPEEIDINPHELFQRVGGLTRQLHDAMNELGGAVESAVSALPDARERLSYIERITGQAAERVLCSAEAGTELQISLAHSARALAGRWESVGHEEARQFFSDVETSTTKTNEIFSQIIVAQDFHDLTGQVLKRVIGIAQNLEKQLLDLLLESTNSEKRAEIRPRPDEPQSLAGPVVSLAAGADVVVNQAQVDDLLESLGF
jgi:chemotaxis protein CheZ